MLTNFAKTLVWKQDYDVKLWRNKQRTTNTNDYPMPLNETPPWKFSAYATACHHNSNQREEVPLRSPSSTNPKPA